MAVSLRDRGLHPVLVDRATEVGASWRARYDRLKLNTGRQFSHLPGRRYPKGTGAFPTRDQVAEHLDRHAREPGIDLRLGVAVTRVDRHRESWRLRTPDGDIDTHQVVIATGYEHTPHIPEWPGMCGFPGQVGHSSGYRNATPYAGRRVLVVGAGSSALEVVHDLAVGGAAKAWLAVRTPPNILPRALPGGLPSDFLATPLYHAPPWFADTVSKFARTFGAGDLSEFGLPTPQEGAFARGARIGKAPAIVDSDVIRSIRTRAIEIVPTVAAFDGGQVELIDGRRLDPEAVICATGYVRGLEPVVGHLGILDGAGVPRFTGETAAAPGLRFIGFLSRPGLIGFVAKQSRRMAARIAEELATPGVPSEWRLEQPGRSIATNVP
jgi:hypothetical protein